MRRAAPGAAALRWVGARLQRRIALGLAAVLCATSAVLLVLLSLLYTGRIAAENARAALQMNALLQTALENAMLKRDIPGLRDILADLGRHEHIARVMILNPEMEVRFASDPALVGQRLDLPEAREALARQTPHAAPLETAGGAVMRTVNPVPNQPPCQTCHGPMTGHPVNGLLIVDYVVTARGAEAQRGALALAGAGLAAIVAATIVVWAFLKAWVINPIARLGRGAAALAAGDLGYRIESSPAPGGAGGPEGPSGPGGDEIAGLTRDFNRMADRLQTTVSDLDASGHFLQGVIDAIPDAVRVIGPDFRLLMANAAYRAAYPEGAAPTCFASSHGRSAPCPDTLVLCPLAELRAVGSRLTCRQTHVGRDGQPIHVEVAAARVQMSVAGAPTAVVVEAIRNLAEQARISHEERLSELGLLATGVAHEINNPLSSVELALGAIQDDLEQGRVGTAPARLDTIRVEIARALSITDSLLMLSQPPVHDGRPARDLIDLDRVVPSALSLLTYQATAAGVEIAIAIAPGLRLLGAESDVRMIVTNLCLNALHAMPKGGMVKVSGAADGADVVLAVTDTGHGIAPEDLPRIFLPFWTRRADGTSGRGLGLSIVQAILERMGGRVSVESRLDAGSVFTLRFPNPDAPAPARREGAAR